MASITKIVTPAPVMEVPQLDIDKIIYRENGGIPHARGKLERRIVYNLMLHMYANGFILHSVYDGEDEPTPLTDVEKEQAIKLAMEDVFNLDESSLRFIKAHAPNEDDWHGVWIILGNGIDCIADYNYFDDDRDSFNAIMEAFEEEKFE